MMFLPTSAVAAGLADAVYRWTYRDRGPRPDRRCRVCTIDHSPRCPDNRRNRWPLDPLLDLVPGRSHTALLQRVGVSGSTIARAARDGLSDKQADHWATRLDVHPSMVWPDWDRAALTVPDDQFVNGNGWRPAWEHHHLADLRRTAA